MGKVFINETSLTAIGDAIREKTGETALLSPAEMATAIAGISAGGSGDGMPNPITFTGADLSGLFQNNRLDWVYLNYGDRIQTSGITNCANIFKGSTSLIELPFAINTSNTTSGCSFANAFEGCTKLEKIDYPLNHIAATGAMFSSCERLRELPEMTFVAGAAGGTGMFMACRSLRSIPEEILNKIYSTAAAYYSCHLWNMFQSCNALDEVRGLNPRTGRQTNNLFNGFNPSNAFMRIKEFIFATQEDGTPYVVEWKGQTIDMSNCGISSSDSSIIGYNSGITADKKVTNTTEYEALKNDPDYYTGDKKFSRYNLQSAINTINSLPDTSAYLATQTDGSTNTIKFNYYEGSATDGGMIGNMTEETIAIATAKGWTVSIIQQ